MRSQETYLNMSGMLQMLLGAKAGGPYAVTALIIAGGGGGAAGLRGAGGGAGGVQESASAVLTPLTGYTVTVGSGGNGASAAGYHPGAGSNSSFNGTTSTGGSRYYWNTSAQGGSGHGGYQLSLIHI